MRRQLDGDEYVEVKSQHLRWSRTTTMFWDKRLLQAVQVGIPTARQYPSVHSHSHVHTSTIV